MQSTKQSNQKDVKETTQNLAEVTHDETSDSNPAALTDSAISSSLSSQTTESSVFAPTVPRNFETIEDQSESEKAPSVDTEAAKLVLDFFASLGEIIIFPNVEKLKEKVITKPMEFIKDCR